MLICVKREQCCVIDGQNGDFPTFCAILSVVSILLDTKNLQRLGDAKGWAASPNIPASPPPKVGLEI